MNTLEIFVCYQSFSLKVLTLKIYSACKNLYLKNMQKQKYELLIDYKVLMISASMMVPFFSEAFNGSFSLSL